MSSPHRIPALGFSSLHAELYTRVRNAISEDGILDHELYDLFQDQIKSSHDHILFQHCVSELVIRLPGSRKLVLRI